MQESSKLRDRLRILLILYFFSEDRTHPKLSDCVKLLESEVKIQKIDFLLRYPSYFCYELILLIRDRQIKDGEEIKAIIKEIFGSKEPQIRTQEMQRFFFGAFEKLDNVIAFLKSLNLIHYESDRSIDGRIVNKKYWVTKKACNAIKNSLLELESIKWYSERCKLIHSFFGGLSGTELKEMQYEIEEYKNASLNSYIQDIEQKTKDLFFRQFKESL